MLQFSFLLAPRDEKHKIRFVHGFVLIYLYSKTHVNFESESPRLLCSFCFALLHSPLSHCFIFQPNNIRRRILSLSFFFLHLCDNLDLDLNEKKSTKKKKQRELKIKARCNQKQTMIYHLYTHMKKISLYVFYKRLRPLNIWNPVQTKYRLGVFLLNVIVYFAIVYKRMRI